MVDDLLAFAETENPEGILFAADIEKAFDSVEYNFIFAPLKKFGFEEDFIRWVKTFLNDSQSCLNEWDVNWVTGWKVRVLAYKAL